MSGSDTVGPVDLTEVCRLVAEGKISAATAVWHRSFGQTWRRADSVNELRGAFAAQESARCKAVSKTLLETSSVSEAVSASFKHAIDVLFRCSSISIWLCLVFCMWMASASALVNVADSKVLSDSLKAGATFQTAIAESIRIGLEHVFLPRLSIMWVTLVIGYSLLASYVSAKGRLLLVHKVFQPSDTLVMSWRRTIGRTTSLTIFYAALDSILNFTLATCLYKFFTSAGFGSGTPITFQNAFEALSESGPLTAIVTGAATFAIVKIVRSFAFHFVEPIIYRFALPVTAAFTMAFRSLISNPGAFIKYYGFVIVFRVAYLIAAVLLMVAYAFLLNAFSVSAGVIAGGPPILFAIIAGRFVFLAPDYFIRTLGVRFLKPAVNQSK